MKNIPSWLILAVGELGQKEVSGKESNPRIVEYLTSVGQLGIDEIPWCSAFVNWIMESNYIKGTDSAMAKSWSNWGKHTELRRGAIVIFNRGKDPRSGHVSILLDLCEDEDLIYCIGGNQRDRVSISAYKSKDVVASRWPKI